MIVNESSGFSWFLRNIARDHRWWYNREVMKLLRFCNNSGYFVSRRQSEFTLELLFVISYGGYCSIGRGLAVGSFNPS